MTDKDQITIKRNHGSSWMNVTRFPEGDLLVDINNNSSYEGNRATFTVPAEDVAEFTKWITK